MSELNDLLMPKLGLTMTEGLLAEWSVASGDSVKAGDALFIVETDKVANEILADADGVMGEILVQAGDTVPVGAVVARWTGPGQGIGSKSSAVVAPTIQSAPLAAEVQEDILPYTAVVGARVVATPFARRLAREHGIDLGLIAGSGPSGRIKAADVRFASKTTSSAPVEQYSHQHSTPVPTSVAQSQPASGLVQAMARRMTEAKQVPHFYLSAEAEISELLLLRERLNAEEGGAKLTLNHFIIAAVARALEGMPQQNCIWSDGHVVQFSGIDIGLAVSTDRGLMAPVLHDLAGCSLDGIAVRSGELIARVREGKGSREDMSGGAITISNAGMFNVTYMTPIINPPQSAILGVGSIREVFRPDADGAPTLKREMGLVLAADHRLHDGVSALKFLNYVIDLLQAPYRLLRSNTAFKG